MNEHTPVFANPLVGLGYEDATLLSPGALSAVCARPGVGKTAFLVQMALWAISHDKNVLHVSLGDPIKKVDLWYHDFFANLSRRSAIQDASAAWMTFFPRRFIMTFKVEGFSVPKLKERMADLVEQKIFIPHVILIDGLESDIYLSKIIEDLKNLARKFSIPVWISDQTQQYPQTEDASRVPAPLHEIAGVFESIVSIEGSIEQIHVRSVKGGSGKASRPSLRLDPSTLLLALDDPH